MKRLRATTLLGGLLLTLSLLAAAPGAGTAAAGVGPAAAGVGTAAPLAGVRAGTLSVQSATIAQGTDIVASYTTDRPSNTNWIGLYTDPGNGPVNQKYVGPSLKWKYAPGTSGTVRLPTGDLDPGRYVVYYLYNDGYTWLADPVSFDIVSGTPSSFVLSSFALKPARSGDTYQQRISGTVRPARTDLRFAKTSGPSWAGVSADGVISGTPAASDGGATASVGIEAVDSDGRRTSATVSIPVRMASQPLVSELKVMSFNLWYGGTNVADYRTKQLRFLLAQDADVVGLQESYSVSARDIATLLGWHYYQAGYSLGIVSRYPITATDSYSSKGTMYGAGVRIRLDDRYVKDIVLWTAHLNYTPYGPYDACNAGMSVEQILRREEQSGRPRQIAGILHKLSADLGNAGTTPVFLVGDFNTPSHLDWVEAARAHNCGYVVPWPTTLNVERAGMTDSFRVANPDPAAVTGDTWSPVVTGDPQDRIDFVTYKGNLTVLGSVVLDNNEWTSDHRAALTTFRIN